VDKKRKRKVLAVLPDTMATFQRYGEGVIEVKRASLV